ncbi:MAG: hypothetical protein WCK49_03565 [Myxococcaceae bacterium]
MDLIPGNEETALRFRIARGMVQINPKKFCEQYGLNRFTIQSWEMGHNHINIRTVVRFCEALSAEGVFCSPEWLLKGKGSTPIKLSSRQDLALESLQIDSNEEHKYIQAEIQLFRDNQIQLGREPVVVELGDQAMKPYFNKGNFVGGYLLPERSIDTLLGQIVIVGIGQKNYVVRRLMKESTNYLLVPGDFTERAVSLKSVENVAKIIWHRI